MGRPSRVTARPSSERAGASMTVLTRIKALPAIPDSTDQMDFDEFDEMNFSGD